MITGGSGFIGSAMLWGLNRMGEDNVIVVDHLGCSDKWQNLVNRRFKDFIPKGKFPELLTRKALGPISAIVHMGACSSTTETDADYLMDNNYAYSRGVATSAIEQGIRLIHASSAATYGDGDQGFSDAPEILDNLKPINMYAYSKHLFDRWAQRSGAVKQLAALKFFNVFGPNEYHKQSMRSVVFKVFEQISASGRCALFKSEHPDYPDGQQRRDFIYVKDCVAVMIWLLEHPRVCGLFNLGSGRARTWLALARAVFKAMEKDPQIDFVDMPAELRHRYQYFTRAQMEKFLDAGCPLKPTPLEEAVSDYVQNYLLQKDRYL